MHRRWVLLALLALPAADAAVALEAGDATHFDDVAIVPVTVRLELSQLVCTQDLTVTVPVSTSLGEVQPATAVFQVPMEAALTGYSGSAELTVLVPRSADDVAFTLTADAPQVPCADLGGSPATGAAIDVAVHWDPAPADPVDQAMPAPFGLLGVLLAFGLASRRVGPK